MSLALLFPGQGARGLLEGLALARSWPWGEALIRLAAEVAGVAVDALDARGGRLLEAPRVLQPVLTACSLSVGEALERRGVRPSVVLGQSLGELAALAAAGVLNPEDAVRLAAVRGALMEREATLHPGGLLALGSLTDADRALDLAAPHGGADVAALNAPDEVVVAGSLEALKAMAAVLPVRRIPVAGAWHGRAMAGAVDELRNAVRTVRLAVPRMPAISSVDGDVMQPRGEGLADQLAAQLIRPVQLSRAFSTARALGVDTYVTVGPGVVLRALARRNLGNDVRVLTTENLNDFERTVTAPGRAA